MAKVSDLSHDQKSHLAWRLDNKTACGLITACRIATGELMHDKSLVEIFEWAGCKSRSAKIHATKTLKFGAQNG